MTTSILFYSSYCNHCKEVINELSNSPLAKSIKYICTDSKSVRGKIPKFIKTVPTLIVGQSDQVLVGKKIIDWVKFNSQTNIGPMEQKQNKNDINPHQVNDPGAWHVNEMNSFSDMYSFLDIDTSTQGDGGMSMVHNFELLNDDVNSSCGKQTIPAGSPGRPSFPVKYDTQTMGNNEFGSIQNSHKSDELNKKMEELLSRRETDIPNMPTRI
tara:strand:+ start:1398 stop:2033 length:636 start_codon:yes stop_codon:yes gene_type:complete